MPAWQEPNISTLTWQADHLQMFYLLFQVQGAFFLRLPATQPIPRQTLGITTNQLVSQLFQIEEDITEDINKIIVPTDPNHAPESKSMSLTGDVQFPSPLVLASVTFPRFSLSQHF